MKPYLVFYIVIFLCACSKQGHISPIQSTQISIIDDLTDSAFILHPDANMILMLIDLEDNRTQAVRLRMVLLTDKLYNPTEEMYLPDSATTEKKNRTDDMHYREKLIASFYTGTRKLVNEFHTHYRIDQSLHNSECFATISSELWKLPKSHATKKVLVIYSDLQENTEYFSCYSEGAQKRIQSHPEQVAAVLNKHRQLPNNLEGITVFVVYQPRTRLEDERFYEMLGIYSLLLESRGAKIIVQADNNFHYE